MRNVAQASPNGLPLPTLGSVLDFLRLFWAVDHALQRSSKHMEMTTGITGPQRIAIRIIGKFPGITAGDLAALLHVHPGTLTGIIKRLERQGFIRRRPDARDGRRSLLGLTAKGRLQETQFEGLVEGAIKQIFERTPSEKLQATRDVLESIAMQLSTSLVHESTSQRMVRRSSTFNSDPHGDCA